VCSMCQKIVQHERFDDWFSRCCWRLIGLGFTCIVLGFQPSFASVQKVGTQSVCVCM